MDGQAISKPLDGAGLSLRIWNCLKAEGLTTPELIAERTAKQLLSLQGFGRTGLAQVESVLGRTGLRLAADA